MKHRLIAVIPIIILIVYFLPIGAYAIGGDELYEKAAEASGAENLFDAVPEDAVALLRDAGIDDVDFYTIYNASPRKIIDALFGVFRGGLSEPLSALSGAMCTVLLTAAAVCFTGRDEKLCSAVNLAGGCICILSCLRPLSELAAAAVSAIKLGADFSLVLIPVMTVVTASAGSPFLASAYSVSVTALAQGLSRLNGGVVTPVAGIAVATGCADALFSGMNISRFGALIKKSALWIFTSAAGLFSAFLSLRGVMASSADSLAVRGAKLAVSTFIPVIGSALTEAYSTITGSLSLIKSAVGAFGIIALAAINAPVIVELIMWKLMLSIASAAAAMLGQKGQSDIFSAISGAVTILIACVIFAAFLLIISAAAMLGGGNKSA